MWGQLPAERDVRVRIRFTPTRVGTTLPRRSTERAATVHPHACGDNDHAPLLRQRHAGSPPRVWGQRSARGDPHHRRRFTPTRVGTTRSRWWRRPTGPVHPHACGDNSTVTAPRPAQRGSPPRVWGQHRLQPGQIPPRRFTPTRVGTTQSVDAPPHLSSVHPHACGDNGERGCQRAPPHGSPPRVWGQLATQAGEVLHARFTPTRVGTTPWSCRRARAPSVHPHACGDNGVAYDPIDSPSGSPPRVWGQLHGLGDRLTAARFTPTRVGTTMERFRAAVVMRFTPTRVGTTRGTSRDHVNVTGSPPRVWGQPGFVLDHDAGQRFTPTRVGTTVRTRTDVTRT